MIFKTFASRDDVEGVLANISYHPVKIEKDFVCFNNHSKKSFLKIEELKEHLDDFVVLDLETTGFASSVGDKIVQVAAVRYLNGIPSAIFETLINPQRKIPKGSSNVHHIYDEDVIDKPYFKEIVKSLKEFIGNSLLVGHNFAFDISFLLAEGLNIADNNLACTLSISRRLVHNSQNHKLGTLCKYFELDFFNFHNALEDVLATGEVFKNLLGMYYL
ncbi:MAG: 3'-5' exonuclease [Bacillales bacterium]|jgi:DNA polymerase-3 subunit alpha (Gram-positive type)|nr:3'-5' exonuclease [Bacillales bacterium]